MPGPLPFIPQPQPAGNTITVKETIESMPTGTPSHPKPTGTASDHPKPQAPTVGHSKPTGSATDQSKPKATPTVRP